MRISACLLSRAEPELLAYNVRHLLEVEHVDSCFVCNHVTIDENRAALEPFKQHIQFFDKPDDNPQHFHQNAWRTEMARAAVERHPKTWVVLADSDELWHGLNTLHSIPKHVNSVTVGFTNHFGTRLDPDGPYLPDNMPWCQPTHSRDRAFSKTIHRGTSRITIHHCSHRPVRNGPVITNPPGITLRHYPVRDWDRFLLKCFTSANMGRRKAWREMHEAGTLRAHYDAIHCPPRQVLEDGVREGRVGYFRP